MLLPEHDITTKYFLCILHIHYSSGTIRTRHHNRFLPTSYNQRPLLHPLAWRLNYRPYATPPPYHGCNLAAFFPRLLYVLYTSAPAPSTPPAHWPPTPVPSFFSHLSLLSLSHHSNAHQSCARIYSETLLPRIHPLALASLACYHGHHSLRMSHLLPRTCPRARLHNGPSCLMASSPPLPHASYDSVLDCIFLEFSALDDKPAGRFQDFYPLQFIWTRRHIA